jgi:hypothetical protein
MNKNHLQTLYNVCAIVGALAFANLATVSLFQVSIATVTATVLFNPAVGLFCLVVAVIAKRKLQKYEKIS